MKNTLAILLLCAVARLSLGADAFFGTKPQVGSILSSYNFVIVDGTGQNAPGRLLPSGLLVPITRQLTAGIGLTGGGDLSGDRAFAIDLSELVANQILWDGSQATRTVTFSLSGSTDPVLTLQNNDVGWNVGMTLGGRLRLGDGAISPVNGDLWYDPAVHHLNARINGSTVDIGNQSGVPLSRVIGTGAGLSGGGDLTADRTLSWTPDTFVNNLTLWNSGNSSRTLTIGLSGATDPVFTFGDASVDLTTGTLKQGGTAVVLQSRQVIAGSGMSGGGTLAADRTLTWAPDTYSANITLWDSANASRALTIGLSGANDPVLSFFDALIGFNTGLNLTGALNSGGLSTFTNGTVDLTLTASRPMLSDGSKRHVSGQIDLANVNHVTGTLIGSSVSTNSSSTAGVVSPGSGNLNTVWKTDGSGVPGWRADATGTGFGETSLSTLANNQTLWDSSQATRTLTAGLSGANDPVLTFANGLLSISVSYSIGGSLTVNAASTFNDGINVALDSTFAGLVSHGSITTSNKATFLGPIVYPWLKLGSGTTVNFAVTNSQFKQLTSASTTLTLTNESEGNDFVLLLQQDATGNRTISMISTSTIVFLNSTNQSVTAQPVTNANFYSKYHLFRRDGTNFVEGPSTAPDVRSVNIATGNESSADFANSITDETGSGSGTGKLVFNDAPAITNANLINTTFDATGGNTLKMKGYIMLTHPHQFDGIGAILQTNTSSVTYGQALFANGADASTNAIKYLLTVPEDIDTSVDLRAKFKFRLGGADTGTHRYAISMISVTDSSTYDGTAGNVVNLDFAGDASGASGDVETVAFTTLSNWKSNITAGQHWVIKLARDGDTSDTSTVDSTSGTLVIEYGISQ